MENSRESDRRDLSADELAAQESDELPQRLVMTLIDTSTGGSILPIAGTDGGGTLPGYPTGGQTAGVDQTSADAAKLAQSAPNEAGPQSGQAFVSDKPQTILVQQQESATAGPS